MILTTVLALTLGQTPPQPTTQQVLETVGMCVAILEYPGAYPEAGEKLVVWRSALERLRGTNATAQEAAVSEVRTEIDRIAARGSLEGRNVARAMGTMKPDCFDDEVVAHWRAAMQRSPQND